MDLKEIVGELGRLAGLETLVAELYVACAAACPGDADFWSGLAAQERVHAAHMLEMARLVNRSGGAGYAVQRAFPPAAIRTITAGVEANLRSVRDGSMAGDRLYFAANEIEHSLVESRFHEFLQTEDAEYNTMLKRIVDETRAHRALFEAKVRTLRGS